MSIKTIYIDETVAGKPETEAVQVKTKLPSRVVNDIDEVYKTIASTADSVAAGKEILFLTKNKGAFVKDCPGTRQYTCCGYRILHVATYCSMDCAYCILQTYFHPPLLQLFVNHRDMIEELDRLFRGDRIVRIGTGEFTDSLIWDQVSGLTEMLIPLFAKQNRAVLELKTKTNAVHRWVHMDHNRKTIVSWSLNTERMIRETERGTASLEARLDAARACQEHGFPLAFHFDPLFIYDGCEKEYRSVVERLFGSIGAVNVAWISLGAFRFVPPLKPVMVKRFPEWKIPYGEFIPGLDGKMRYFKPLRMALFRKMVEWIRHYAPDLQVYLCMEDDEVWQDAFGYVPQERGGLPEMLDRRAEQLCGVKNGKPE